jgi:hypothetical protein
MGMRRTPRSNPTEAPAGADANARTENDRRMFGHFREINSASRHLQELVVDAAKELAKAPASLRSAYAGNMLSPAALGRIERKITGQLAAIELLFAVDASEFEWCADEFTSIELNWSEIQDCLASITLENVEHQLKGVAGQLDTIIYYCVSLTLSPAINDTMRNLRVGQPLDLEFEFGKTFPRDAEMRRRLILELSQQTVVIEGGVVDVEQGVIYKASPTRRGQVASVCEVGGLLLAGLLIPLAFAGAGRLLNNWPFKLSDLNSLLSNYVLILLGSAAHVSVEALKSAKTKTRPSFQALNDWVLWVHVRQSQIIKGILYIWLGYILLVFGVPKLDWTAAFFAGYSIDSVTELFLQRFSVTVATKNVVLEKAVAK